MRLSVIIPAYNSAEFIARSLDSVLCMRLEALEVIAVDDGSTDATGEILAEYQREFNNLVIVKQNNRGLSGARNSGMAVASGEYCVFLDADDELDILKIWDEVLPAAESAGLDVALFNTKVAASGPSEYSVSAKMTGYYRRSPKLPIGHDRTTELLRGLVDHNSYLPSSCLYLWKRSHVLGKGLRFREGAIREDHAFTFGLLSSTDSIGYYPVTAHKRVIRSESLSQTWSQSKLARGYLWAYIDAHSHYGPGKKNRPRWQNKVLHRLRRQVERRDTWFTVEELSNISSERS